MGVDGEIVWDERSQCWKCLACGRHISTFSERPVGHRCKGIRVEVDVKSVPGLLKALRLMVEKEVERRLVRISGDK